MADSLRFCWSCHFQIEGETCIPHLDVGLIHAVLCPLFHPLRLIDNSNKPTQGLHKRASYHR